MSAHTPGPWHVNENGRRVRVYSKGGSRIIAEIISPEGLEANARLIAAAPDMLTALHAICTAMKFHPSQGLEEALESAYNQCSDAVEKAEGRS